LADFDIVLIDEENRRDADLMVVTKVRRNGLNPPKKSETSDSPRRRKPVSHRHLHTHTKPSNTDINASRSFPAGRTFTLGGVGINATAPGTSQRPLGRTQQ
jgi:hypothetical protein